MEKRYLEVAGTQVRVEANWKAITSFLTSVGRNSLQGITDLASLPPTDMAPLMAACLNEGERLDGREAHFTGEWIEENCGLAEVSAFVVEFLHQTSPKLPKTEEKKA